MERPDAQLRLDRDQQPLYRDQPEREQGQLFTPADPARVQPEQPGQLSLV